MYLYFDKQGILKEFINDEALRQGNANVNTIYAYFESEVVTGGQSNLAAVAGEMRINDGAVQTLSTWNVAPANESEIPYNPERDLYFFKYGVPYRFYKHVLGSDGETLSNGTAALTINAYNSVSPTVVVAAQGLVTFNIQSSVVLADVFLSESDLAYWVGLLASKENTVNKVTDFTHTDDTHFPTTEAVSELIGTLTTGGTYGDNGKYIKYISETNGIITATAQSFDTNFTNPTNNNAPTTKAVSDYVEANQELEYVVKGSVTSADIEGVFARGHMPVLLVTASDTIVPAYYINTSSTTFTFVRSNADMITYYVIDNSNSWTETTYDFAQQNEVTDRYRQAFVLTSVSGTLTSDQFSALQNENAIALYKKSNNEWVHFTRNSVDSGTMQCDGTSISVVDSSGVLTISYYVMFINSSTKTYTINKVQSSTYTKAQLDSIFNGYNTALLNYIKTMSVSGDILTYSGVSNGIAFSNETFSVTHKLDKDFSGINYTVADAISLNDYLIINVNGTPKKILWSTIYDQLGAGTIAHFLGTYNSLSALQTAYPTANAGDYAYITSVDGADTIITMAIWDATDEEWQVQDLSHYVLDSVFQAFQLTVTAAINGKSKVTLVEWS